MTLKLYRAAPPRYDRIPITRRPAHWRYMAQIALEGLPKNTFVRLCTEMHFTNDAGYNVAVVPELRMCFTGGNARDGEALSDPGGRNVTPNMHHDKFFHMGVKVFKDDSQINTWLYFKVLMHAKSTAANGDDLTIDRNLCQTWLEVWS